MNLQDMGRYVTYRLAKNGMPARLQAADIEPEHLADRLAKLADGNFLYAKVLLNDVEAHPPSGWRGGSLQKQELLAVTGLANSSPG